MVNLFPLIPLSITVLFAIKLSVIYLLAVYYGHVKPFYPYISDSGATHPEAAYFSLLLFLEAILIGMFGWIRFKQIKYIFANNPEFNNNDKRVESIENEKIEKFNKYGLYLSVIAMLGIGIVGCFRSTEHLELHLGMGAFPAFFAVMAYYFIQTWFSYQMIPSVNTQRMTKFRLFISILSVIFGTIMILSMFAGLPQIKVSYSELRGPARLLWDESWGGYVAHCISTITENLMILTVCPFYASFILEFKRIKSNNGRLKFDFISHPNIEIRPV